MCIRDRTHGQSLAIHNNARDTLNKTTGEFYWEGMRSDVSQFVKSCDTCQRIVSKIAMSRSQIKKRHSNKKSRNRKLEIGDKVLLLLPTSNNKLLLQWQGPLIVRDKVGAVSYTHLT